MCNLRSKLLFVALLAFRSIHSSAQTSTTSNPTNGRENNPYTKFGIGELSNGSSVALKGMGNITSAFENPYEINTDNPASYAFLRRTTFEIGAMGSSRTIDGSGLSYTTGTATLSYLTIGIPVNKNGGLVLGFRPYSKVYYSLVDTIFNSPIGSALRSYSGDGGLNYAYAGAAAKWKGLSVGFNLGYLFGTTQYTTAMIPIDTLATNNGYTTRYDDYVRIGGLYWKGGVMYETKIDSGLTLRIGGTISIGQNITERLNAYQVAAYNFGDTTVNDTVNYAGQQKGRLKLPMSYSAGISLSKEDKWNVGIDYTATQWSDFNSSPYTYMNTNVASGSYKFSAGVEYTPDINNIRSYFSRCTYRFGGYYGLDYLKINGNDIPYYGMTAGASLPFRRSLSRLHTALEVGRLGSTSAGMIQETYVRFSLGVSFNDLWFIKRKYD